MPVETFRKCHHELESMWKGKRSARWRLSGKQRQGGHGIVTTGLLCTGVFSGRVTRLDLSDLTSAECVVVEAFSLVVQPLSARIGIRPNPPLCPRQTAVVALCRDVLHVAATSARKPCLFCKRPTAAYG